MEIKNLDRKYFEKNLSNYKLDKADKGLKKILDGVTLDSIEEMNSVLHSDIINLDVEETEKNDMNMDDSSKLLYINVKENDKKALGAMNFAYKETGKEGLIILSEVSKYLPALITALSNLKFSEIMEKMNPNINRKPVQDNKVIDITKEDIEVGEYHDLTSNLTNAPLKLLFADIDMEKKNLPKDQELRLKYMTNIEMAFYGLMKLEKMSMEDELSKIGSDDEELKAIKENYIKFLESNKLQNVFLDYDIKENDLRTSLYFKDVYGISTFKITKTFKNVFSEETELPYYTEYDTNKYNLEDLEKDDITMSKKLSLLKEGMAIRLGVDFEEGTELTDAEKSHYLVENEVLELMSFKTPIDTIYLVYKTMNFIKTIAEYDKDIYNNPSEILKWLPRLNIIKDDINE